MLVVRLEVLVGLVCPFCLTLKKKEFFSSCARRSLFKSRRIDLRRIIYLPWMDQGVLNLKDDTWNETSHNALLICLLLSNRVADELR